MKRILLGFFAAIIVAGQLRASEALEHCESVHERTIAESLMANIEILSIGLGFRAPIAEDIRAKYNACVNVLRKEALSDFKMLHKNHQSMNEGDAKNISDKRNAIKEHYQKATPILSLAFIYLRNAFKYGAKNQNFDRMKQGGKSPEDIAYAALKTDGRDLGVSRNDFADIYSVYQTMKKFVGDPAETGFYPEAISVDEAGCFEEAAKKVSLTKQLVVKIAAACDIKPLY